MGSQSKPAVSVDGGVRVPNFVGAQAVDVAKTAQLVGIRIAFRDAKGRETTGSEGVVTSQKPAVDQVVAKGSLIEVTVAAQSVVTPSRGGYSRVTGIL